MRGSKIRGLLLVALLVVGSLIGAQSASARTQATDWHHHQGAPQHIFWIMMENHGYSEIIGNWADAPFINLLAAHAGQATDYYGVTHPSLPNYLSSVSGSFQGIWDDCAAGATIFCPPEEFIPGSGDGTDGKYLTKKQIARTSSISWSRTG
jgi:phosphatidylinositol-3-phosphatase